jgi:recombination protein RecA
MVTEKEKALELAVGLIEKQFGKGAIMKLREAAERPAVEAIPSGSLALDLALGVGGIPRGRVTEIFGPEGSGKTTLGQHIIAQAQKRGGIAAYIDVEHALDPTYAANCGVNLDDLLISQPDTGEEALEIAEALVRSGAVDAIVIDSVAALVPRAEIEGEMGDAHVGLQARRALKFYSSVRIDLRRVETIKQGNLAIGTRVKAKVVKNKVAPPFRSAEFDIMFDSGISREGNIVDLGVGMGVIKKAGAFFSYGDIRLGQGRESAKKYLKENPELAQEIEKQVRASAVTTYSFSNSE